MAANTNNIYPFQLYEQGLDRIESARFRQLVRSVIDSGAIWQAFKLIDSYEDAFGNLVPPYRPCVNRGQVELESNKLLEEFSRYGLTCSLRYIRSMVALRAIMLPLNNQDLAFALSRLWTFTAYVDDICESSMDESLRFLNVINGQTEGKLAIYSRHAFSELKPYTSPVFEPVFHMMFYKSFLGTAFESKISQTDKIYGSEVYEYIRRANGYCEFWFLGLQFFGGALEYTKNINFWISIFPDCIRLLNDFNDIFSIYKEAIHGASFSGSRIYRKSETEKVDYIDVFRQTLKSGEMAYQAIMDAAGQHDREAQRVLDNFMRGFIYWQFYSERYRWKEIFPEAPYLDW